MESLPSSFILYQNYPNPFNPTTSISYQIPESGLVSLQVYDMLGRKIEVLVNGKKEAGQHTMTWDAEGFPSGVYYYKLSCKEFNQVNKMILIK